MLTGLHPIKLVSYDKSMHTFSKKESVHFMIRNFPRKYPSFPIFGHKMLLMIVFHCNKNSCVTSGQQISSTYDARRAIREVVCRTNTELLYKFKSQNQQLRWRTSQTRLEDFA